MKFPQIIKDKAVYSFTEAEKASVKNGDILLFSFVMKAIGTCSPIKIRVGETEMTYYIPVQKTKIVMPLVYDGFDTVTLDTECEIELLDSALENRGDIPFEETELESGMHMLDSFESFELPETGLGVGKTNDVVRSGNYIYSIGDGFLSVTDISDGERVLSRLTGLGDVRQIALCASGEDVIVTARQNGVYIVNVSDPSSPYIRSSYDSIELATGLCVCGSYAFVCNRQYGVEIVDVSDPDNPKHVTNMRVGGEVQSCTVKNGVFYGGLWAEGCVKMFDVSDPEAPVFLGEAILHGRGDGMSIAVFDGKTYLYAATGQHTYGYLPPTTPLTDLRYGQGNGLDIFDVTDPKAPVWLSTSVIDGRFYTAAYDYWETEYGVDEYGHRYVYLVSTYNGVYIYNVDDPRAPVRLAHVCIPIARDSERYHRISSVTRVPILPYDQKLGGRSAVGAITVVQGTMYIAGCHTDLHVFRNKRLLHVCPVETDRTVIAPSDKAAYLLDGIASEHKLFRTRGQIYAVTSVGEYLYVSAGAEGIVVLTPDMERIGGFKTEGSVMWLEARRSKDGKYIFYTAERNGGFAIYELVGVDGFREIYRNKSVGCVRQLRVTDGGEYAVLHIGRGIVKVLSLDSFDTVLEFIAPAIMYHHNLTPIINGRYIGVWDNTPFEWWIDLGGETPVLIKDRVISKTAMSTGITALGKSAFEITREGGIALFDPETETAGDAKVFGKGFGGKPTVCGDILVTCDRIHGKITFTDISDISAPRILKTVEVKGNPDIAMIENGYAYIPLGYQGLVRIKV